MYRAALAFAAGFVIPVTVTILKYSCIYVRVRSMNEHWKNPAQSPRFEIAY